MVEFGTMKHRTVWARQSTAASGIPADFVSDRAMEIAKSMTAEPFEFEECTDPTGVKWYYVVAQPTPPWV